MSRTRNYDRIMPCANAASLNNVAPGNGLGGRRRQRLRRALRQQLIFIDIKSVFKFIKS